MRRHQAVNLCTSVSLLETICGGYSSTIQDIRRARSWYAPDRHACNKRFGQLTFQIEFLSGMHFFSCVLSEWTMPIC